MRKVFPSLVIGTKSSGLALAVGVAVLHPLAAFAASDLFGLLGASSGSATATLFGTIDPVSGAFSQIGGPTGLPPTGHYAPVFDPALNAFFVTGDPISATLTSHQVVKIDAATGAVTSFDTVVPGPLVSAVAGLGVASSPTVVVPEPSTWVMMVVGFAGLGYGAFRRRRPRLEGVAA